MTAIDTSQPSPPPKTLSQLEAELRQLSPVRLATLLTMLAFPWRCAQDPLFLATLVETIVQRRKDAYPR